VIGSKYVFPKPNLRLIYSQIRYGIVTVVTNPLIFAKRQNFIICDCSSIEGFINCLFTSLNFILVFYVVSSLKLFVIRI